MQDTAKLVGPLRGYPMPTRGATLGRFWTACGLAPPPPTMAPGIGIPGASRGHPGGLTWPVIADRRANYPICLAGGR